MRIDKAEIERVKTSQDLVALAQSKGIKLVRKGKQWVGLCPFHNDHEPSLIVDPRKQLWNCLGACREGGDVYKFVMKSEGLDFRQAHLRLGGQELPWPETSTPVPKKGVSAKTRTTGGEERDRKESLAEPPGLSGSESRPSPVDVTAVAAVAPPSVLDQVWLERTAEHYAKRLKETPQAQQYLASRGLGSAELVAAFGLGYSDGSLPEKLPPEGRQALQRAGVLTERGQELMKDCVVFPLVDPFSLRVVSLYGRHIPRQRVSALSHLYLPGERRGVFNPQGARNTEEVILTESVIDAAALWSVGIRNGIPVYGINGLTEVILHWLEECRVKRVVLMLDSDEAGRAAVATMSARIEERGLAVRSVELPAKDAAEFVEQGGTAQRIRQLFQQPESSSLAAFAKVDAPAARVEAAPLPADSTLRLEASADGALLASASNREYRIRGLSPNGLDRLRVNLRLKINSSFHLDTLDLYQARSRSTFAQAAAKQCGVPEAQIGKDLLELVEKLEAARLEMIPDGQPAKTPEAPMTVQEREAALAYLKAPNLLERIVDDFRACGLIGERSSVLVSYLAAISRKLAKPLSLLIVARTGAGKSSLQDALCSLVPPEDLVRVTRLTGQALFYKDPDSLRGKVLAIAEEEGAAQAVYSLRTLASDQWLSIAATRTDPQTGKLHTEHYEIHGPVAIVITTTSPEAFDEETRSRFVLLTLNESVEQTRAILACQRQAHTLEGVLADAQAEGVRRRHHHLQRLLRPLAVVNPFVEQLSYPSERLIARREQKKYLTLINTLALLHQYQRETKRAAQGAAEVEYVEVTAEDIRLANELAREVLWQSWDELAPPVRGLKQELEALYQRRAQELKIEPSDVQLTRREIREATGWSDWQVRVYCQRLLEMEYLALTSTGNGRPCLYQLVEPGRDDRPQLNGLAEVPPAAVPGAVATGSAVAQQLKTKAVAK